MRIYFRKPSKIYRLTNILTTSDIELKDISKAWFAISLAFGIVFSRPWEGGFLAIIYKFFPAFVISAVAVGLGFLLHELAHKYFAQRYGFKAEFRSFDEMLFLAVIMSFFGFVIAAPGAVMILARKIDIKKNGIISVAGPVMNLVIAGIFFLIAVLVTGGLGNSLDLMRISFFEVLELPFGYALLGFGFFVNSLLALFNMIPFWLFDGAKIFRWNKIVWSLVVLVAILFIFVI